MGPNFKSCRLIYPSIVSARHTVIFLHRCRLKKKKKKKKKTFVRLDLLNFTHDHLYFHSSSVPGSFRR